MSTAPIPKISTVPERWGSSSMSTATAPSTRAKGSTPVENCFILSWLREIMWENTSTTENLAISLGCRVPRPGMTIQRLQPLYSGMKSTTTSSTREMPNSHQANLCQTW